MSTHVSTLEHLCSPLSIISFFFFFNDTATTEIYTLSLHDALPICPTCTCGPSGSGTRRARRAGGGQIGRATSELQSRPHLVCRLLLEKKKKAKAERVCERNDTQLGQRGAHDAVSG